MATYNGAKHIKEQIDSILNQDLSAFPNAELELIISDDGSTDDTLNIINSYQDKRIKVLHHKQEKKHRFYNKLYAATANFIKALSMATGKYLFFSDQDDVWYPKKISETLHVLIKNGGVVATAFDIIDDENKNIGEVIYREEPFWKPKKHHSTYGFSMGISREELKYILPMPSFIPQHDTFIHHIAQRRKKLFFIDKKCAAHRWTEKENTSNTASDIPAYIKLLIKLYMYTIVIYRCYVR